MEENENLNNKIENEISKCYWEYAWFTICDRSLPSIFDGLKPVHRRILYSMWVNGNRRTDKHKKSMKVIGPVMGDYHPHGDAPVYQALVRMAQDFNMRTPLIDGQGNFGSIDGDGPAAPRYTEARLSWFSHEFFEDWGKESVDVVPTYDGSLTEPVVLPSRAPNLLINGSTGISVGISTSIPSHNLREIVDALVFLINNNPDEVSIDDLFNFIKGPDFPTGGKIIGVDRIRNAYRTGEGTITVIGKHFFEGDNIVFYEIPYQNQKADIVRKITEAINEGKITGASYVRDESGRDGMRIFIKVKNNFQKEIVLNQILQYSQMKSTFRICLFALNEFGHPHLYNLKSMLVAFLKFRDNVIIRRTKFELEEYRKKAHILIGLGVALENIDEIVGIIRSSDNVEEAKTKLRETPWKSKNIKEHLTYVGFTDFGEEYFFSEEQIKSICEVRLQNIVKLEKNKIENEFLELRKKMEECNKILNSEEIRKEIIQKDLLRIAEKYKGERRTLIEDGLISHDEKDLISREDIVIMINEEGYIKRIPITLYRNQRRGGTGKSSYNSISITKFANTHDKLLFFTNSGLAFSMFGYQIPTGDHASKGRALVNLLDVEKDDFILECLVIKEKEDYSNKGIIFITSKGNVRKNSFDQFLNLRSNGKKYMVFEEDEKLIKVDICEDNQCLFIATSNGKAVLCSISEFRKFESRGSNGVRGCKLKEKDRVVSAMVLDNNPELEIFTITENGFGKSTRVGAYRKTRRGASGVLNISTKTRNGKVVKTLIVKDDHSILLTTKNGNSILFPSEQVKTCSRYASGVRLCRVDSKDKIFGAELISSGNKEDLEIEQIQVVENPEIVSEE